MAVALLTPSCATVIHDVTFYVDAGPAGAVSVNFLTPGSKIILKSQWDTMREGMFCMDADSYGDFKSEIEELCSATTCTYEMIQAVMDSYSEKLEGGKKAALEMRAQWQQH